MSLLLSLLPGFRIFQSDAARAAQTAAEYPELYFTAVVSQVQETRTVYNWL